MSMSPKTCAVCGREMQWRKRWEREWENVKYCSDACRRRKKESRDDTVEHAILQLLGQRARDASICPSEVARAMAGEDWRGAMEPVREAARRLVARGELVITQGGHVVDPSRARGPIRLARPRT